LAAELSVCRVPRDAFESCEACEARADAVAQALGLRQVGIFNEREYAFTYGFAPSLTPKHDDDQRCFVLAVTGGPPEVRDADA
jgi:hypothetical protein